MKSYFKLLLFVFLFAASQSAFAQANIRLGLAGPSGDVGSQLKGGAGLEVSWTTQNVFDFEGLSLGGTIGYYSFAYEDFESINLNIIPILGIAEYNFLEGNFRPYIVGGIGYYYRFLSDSDSALLTTSPFGIKLGGGIRYGFGDSFGLTGELAYNIAGSSSYAVIGGGIYIKL